MLLQPVETVCWAKGKSVTLIVLSYCPSVHFFFFLLVTTDDHRNTISDLAVLVSVVKNSSGVKQDSL